MAVEVRADLTIGQSRRLRRHPEEIYVNPSGSEIRVAEVRSGEFPYSRSLLFRRFDKVNGRWQAGSEGGTFSCSDASRRSIAIIAASRGYTRRRTP